jgi:all-trans-retinol 13,14-reductase
MRVKLKTRKEIVKGIILLEFDTLGQIVNFEPGQFFTLTLISPPFTDIRGNSRIFGFVNSPTKKDIQIITKSGPSAFKKWLMQMPIETEVQVDKINGIIDLPKNPNEQLVFLASGIGIAPIMSILRYLNEKQLQYHVILIYVNDSREQTPFFEELTNYSKVNALFKLILTESINNELIQNNLPILRTSLYFVKGEQQFVVGSIKILQALGIETNKISMEIFTGY